MFSDQSPAINLSRVVPRNADIASADGQMMSMEKGDYEGANGLGMRIWTTMAQPRLVAALCDRLIRPFEIDEPTCRTEVLAFIQQLRENALLQVVDAG